MLIETSTVDNEWDQYVDDIIACFSDPTCTTYPNGEPVPRRGQGASDSAEAATVTEDYIMDALAEGIACYFNPNCTPPERKAVAHRSQEASDSIDSTETTTVTEEDIMDALAEGIACYFDPNCTPPERKAVLGDVDFSLMATTQTPVLPHAEASNNAAIYVTGAGVLGAAALVTYAFFKRQPKTHSLE